MRQRLLQVALPYAESLNGRAGVVGVMLYGSLVRGSLTPFSDVDIALFYESDPPHRIEHRLVSGTKVDLISFPLQDVTNLLDPIPSGLYCGFPFSYVFESLLLAGPESILHDPTGEIARVKTRLLEETSYRRLAMAPIREELGRTYVDAIKDARHMLEQDCAREALGKAQRAADALAECACACTISKRTDEAADMLGMLAFAAHYYETMKLASAPEHVVEDVWAATRALWEHSKQAASVPLKDRLRQHGIGDLDHLELIGDYDLFWPGGGINELGRVLAEVDLSIRWCRSELDRGSGQQSLDYLWACKGSGGIRRRWERLDAALSDTGYDCSEMIKRMLQGEEFSTLGDRLDLLLLTIDKSPVIAADAKRAIELAQEMERLLRQALPEL